MDYIVTDCGIANGNPRRADARGRYLALWDTGAVMTCVSGRVAHELGLEEATKARNETAGGVIMSSLYYVDVELPCDAGCVRMLVAECPLTDVDVLIGMDIIKHGTMTIGNQDGKTTFSFEL